MLPIPRAWVPGVVVVLAASLSWPQVAPAVERRGGPPASLGHARVEVDLSTRRVSFYRDGARVATYPIGVGKPEWPTRPGSWRIYRIDFNPDWRPPPESWASERRYTPPGHPENPMGRVRMVYDPPRSIHGTNDLASIGGARSHGSIRIANAEGLELARLLMEAAGERRSEAWYRDVRRNPGKMVSVHLTHRIPIRVR